MPQHVGRYEANGYRYYTRRDATWLEFIKCLRATGMPIRDVRRYTELMCRGEDTIAARMQLLKQHRCRVEEHLIPNRLRCGKIKKNSRQKGMKITDGSSHHTSSLTLVG
jgi:DNA-binding transcriptional MerR regulator